VGLAMKPNEKPDVMLARERLATLLVAEAGDPLVVAELSAVAHVAVASGGKKTGNLAPDVLGDALRAGLLADPAFADALLGVFAASDDEYFRRTTIYAFSGDAADAGKLLAAAPKMRTGELRYLYQYLAAEPAARAVLWSWFKANYGTLLARVSTQGMSRASGILANACDAPSREALERFFRPKTATLVGVSRPLALAEEKIDACIAFKAAKGAEIDEALHAQP